jgi:uncharacterized membrane protein YqjE
MEPGKPITVGYVQSIRSLADGLLATLQERFTLFTVELQEEKLRLIQTFIWISATVFTAMMAVMFASLLLVYLFWESARLAALGGLTMLYVGALVAIVLAFRRFLARQPQPFAATLEAVGADRTCIRNQS